MAVAFMLLLAILVWYGGSSLNAVAVGEAYSEGVGIMQLVVLQYAVGVLCGILYSSVFNAKPRAPLLLSIASILSPLASLFSIKDRRFFSSQNDSLAPTTTVLGSSSSLLMGLPSLIVRPPPSWRDPVQLLCAAMHVGGSLATLASLRLLRPPFVQLSKALEPLFGAFIAYALGFPVRLRLQLPIVACISFGVALTAVNEAYMSCWNTDAFILAVLSCIW